MTEERSRVADVQAVSNHHCQPDTTSKEGSAVNSGQLDTRVRDLRPFASDFDLALFTEAQVRAAEDIEAEVGQLPDVASIKYIQLGRFEMEVWYASPYPEEFASLTRIHVCQFCLKYVKSATQMRRHASKCVWKHPPGDEIYRKDRLSVFEVCGQLHKNYCQSLCLLAKCFLDHKTMFFHVEPFLFYVMTVADSTTGCHLVGYFSKEKSSAQNFNVSCILTLPPYQRQGFGRLLIDFSYLLSRRENKIGSPEKPLSDLGLLSYRSYWKDVILDYMCHYAEAATKNSMSLRAFCDERGINCNDIVSTLQWLGMIKYWRGQHLILKRQDLMAQHVKNVASRNNRPGLAARLQLCPSALKWEPYEETWRDKRHAEQIKRSQEESRSMSRSSTNGQTSSNGHHHHK